MSGNPFDDDSISFYVLINEVGQYSLWPSFVTIPSGWSKAINTTMARSEALDYVDENWIDMTPLSPNNE